MKHDLFSLFPSPNLNFYTLDGISIHLKKNKPAMELKLIHSNFRI